MKFTPDPHPNLLGLFEFDGTEQVQAVKAAILAERARKFPHLPAAMISRFHDVKPVPKATWRRTVFRAPKPGDGVVQHDAPTARAIAACAAVGAEFWCLGPHMRHATGVRDGQFVDVVI